MYKRKSYNVLYFKSAGAAHTMAVTPRSTHSRTIHYSGQNHGLCSFGNNKQLKPIVITLYFDNIYTI